MTTPKTDPAAAPLPIVIAGGGCVGLFLALVLAHSAQPHRIVVLEPAAPDPTATRAMAHQPPTYPLLSRVPGLLPDLIAAGSLSAGLCFRTGMRCGSRVIAGKTFDNGSSSSGGGGGGGGGAKGQLLLPQGKFQDVLMQRLRGLGGRCEVRVGWGVRGFREEAERVAVEVEGAGGACETLDAVLLVGADGAHSSVRRGMGMGLEGETLDAQLVATDIRFDFKRFGFADANFVVDPVDYGLIGRIDEQGLWRVSYGVPVGMSEAEVQAGVEEKLKAMLPDGGLDGDGKVVFEVVRVAPYKAQQRCVESFWKGRIGLVGDAAHLTNPYAGLGLASGIADAASLAQVLERILTGQASDPSALLASWSEVRRRTFFSIVDKPSRMAYMRVRSRVDSQEDIEALLNRDPLVGALKKGMPMMPPSLEMKGEELEGW